MTAATAGRSITLVASKRPPSPVSSSRMSAGWRAKARKAAAVVISKKVMGAPQLACSHSSSSAASSASSMSAPASRMRSLKRMRCGVVKAWTLQPRGFEAGAQEGDGRALAVGAGDMDHRRQPTLRLAQRRQQPQHAVERQVDELRMQPQQPLQDGVNAHAGLAGISAGSTRYVLRTARSRLRAQDEGNFLGAINRSTSS